MADERIKSVDPMTGSGHATLPDTLNNLALIEHDIDGTHKIGTAKLLNGYLYLYDTAGQEYIVTVGDTFQDIDNLIAGLESGAGYVVGNGANGTETIGAMGAGRYSIKINIGFKSHHHVPMKFQVVKNGVVIDGLQHVSKQSEPALVSPSVANIVKGTLVTGAVGDLEIADGKYHQISEDSDPTGFISEYSMFSPTIHAIVKFWGRYSGSGGHNVKAQMRNFTRDIDEVQNGGTAYKAIRSHTSGASTEPGVGADWTSYWISIGATSGEPAWTTTTVYDDGFNDMTAETTDLYNSTTIDYFRELPIPLPHSDYVDSVTNEQIVRFIHTSTGTNTHDLYVDKLAFVDELSTGEISMIGPDDLIANDIIKAQFTTPNIGDEFKIIHLSFALEKIG